MHTDIQFRGVTDTPSDFSSHDGDLSLALGVIPEDQALRPIAPPVQYGWRHLIYIHKTPTYRNYLMYQDGQLSFGNMDNSSMPIRSFVSIQQITHMGNILMVLDMEGIHYLRYSDSSYIYLGTWLPFIPMRFGLRLASRQQIAPALSLISQGSAAAYHKEQIGRVLSALNTTMAKATRAGEFTQPFLVRYALRLYDGSLTKHSAPVLMMPRSAHTLLSAESSAVRPPDITLRAAIHGYELQTSLIGDDFEWLDQWRDIIQGVEIFVSLPFWTYTQDPQFNEDDWRRHTLFNQDTLWTSTTIASHDVRAQRWEVSRQSVPEGHSYVNIPAPERERLSRDIRDCGTFYHVASIPLDQLSKYRGMRSVPIERGTLDSLATREVMKDDYGSHDQLLPRRSFIYNGRLHLAPLSRRRFSGFAPALSAPYTNVGGRIGHTQLYVRLRDARGSTYAILTEGDYDLDAAYYYFYPDPSAYELVISTQAGSWTVPMQRHIALHGAVAFLGLDTPMAATAPGPPAHVAAERTGRVEDLTSKIYASEVSNPFIFPARSINTIGTGDIIGVCAATRAISQGQYGQFPLYAFTTEGVWALSVSADGTYSAAHPTTRDVCINADSITPIDTAVLFATQRGVLLLSGSEAVPITDGLMGRGFSLGALPDARELQQLAGLGELQVRAPELRKMLEQLRILYDYPHQRLYLFTPHDTMAYVYSLRSRMWGMTAMSIARVVPAYPEAIGVAEDGTAWRYDRQDEVSGLPAMVVTRPIDFGAPSAYKTIRQLIPRGIYCSRCVRSALYGTRDYAQWELVASSEDGIIEHISGSPYKAFRIVLLCDLSIWRDAIEGVSVSYVPRFGGKLHP